METAGIRRHLIPMLIIAAAALAVFANSVGGDFVWADHTIIVEGNGILHGADEWRRVFTKPLWSFAGGSTGKGGYYRPVVSISYTLDHLLFGDQPAGYHVTNILLHCANSVLLFLLFATLFPRSKAPFLAALLFAVHPIHTEAVSWISGRTGLLAAFGMFLSLLLHARAGGKPLRIAGSTAAFAFALGAKEVALVTPLLLAAIALFTPDKGKRKASFLALTPHLLIVPLYLFLRHGALGAFGTGSTAAIPFSVLIPTMLRVLGGYFRLLLIPFPQHTNDAVLLSTGPFDSRALFALAFIGAAIYGARRIGKGRREIAFGGAWIAVAMLPFLNIVPLLHFRAERLLYLPSAGFLLVAGALLEEWGAWFVGREKRAGLEPGVIVTGALALLLGFATVSRNAVWKDDRTLFTDTLRKNAYAPEARYMLGYAAYQNGAYTDAVGLFRSSLALDPRYVAFLPTPWALANLGYAQYKMGDFAGAEPAFRQALSMIPDMERAKFGLALSLGALGEHEEAMAIYRGLIENDSTHVDARYNLGLELEAKGENDAAEAEYRAIIGIDPDRKEAHTNLGSLLAREGRPTEALAEYREALRLAPDDPKLHFNVGLLFARSGQYAPAAVALREALRLDPDYPDAEELLEEVAKHDTTLSIPPDSKQITSQDSMQ